VFPVIMVVLDGASDRSGSEQTPLEMAKTPHLDSFVRTGSLGQMFTVGKGIAPESDAGVFSLLGYDPMSTHLSRGVVEAVGANVAFHDGDLALRAGFATVEGDKLVDRRAGRDLSTTEAVRLGAALNSEVRLKDNVEFEFKSTVGHRAVLVFRTSRESYSSNISNFDPAYVRKGNISLAMPGRGPYDIPKCEPLDSSREAITSSALVNQFGFKARSVLDHNPVNMERRGRDQLPANFVLMRDAGTEMPKVEGFRRKWGLGSVMIADLPAELGIGKILGMDVKELSPGTSLPDYSRRAEVVLQASKEYDFVYVHLKGPDEPGHDGFRQEKARRISDIDEGFFSVLARDGLTRRVLCVTCDHSTPWREKGHSDDPVPVLVRTDKRETGISHRFTEAEAKLGVLGMISQGSLLMHRLTETRKNT
jgi:2,3-bisphosphoglycerate-independent phosphoglycerate mutase